MAKINAGIAGHPRTVPPKKFIRPMKSFLCYAFNTHDKLIPFGSTGLLAKLLIAQ